MTSPAAPSDRVPGAATEALVAAAVLGVGQEEPWAYAQLGKRNCERVASAALAAAGGVLADSFDQLEAEHRELDGGYWSGYREALMDVAVGIRRRCGLPPEGAGGGEG